MSSQKRNGLKAAILAMSFIQMAGNATASILADIAKSFPAASDTAVQYLMTFPNLFIVGVSIWGAFLSAKISKRTLAAVGLSFGCISGLGAWCFHKQLVWLYVWAGILGIGTGLVVPVATSLISDWFQGAEKESLLGYQTAAANVGSMLMTYFGGILAIYGWHYTYLVYLFVIPGLLLTLKFVPKEVVLSESNKKMIKTEKTGKFPQYLMFYLLTAAIFMILFYVGPTNFSMLITERNGQNNIIAGTATTMLLAGGTVMGFTYGGCS